MSRPYPAAEPGQPPPPPAPPAWVAQLTASGPAREDAVRQLHQLMLRAARRQVANMPERHTLGSVRCAEIVVAAADEATMNVLGKLDSFEGRSRFTTWAYKFAILQVATEVRRAAWHDREVHLDKAEQPTSRGDPQSHAEAAELAEAIRVALQQALTPHQRRVMVALLIDHVPIDVLAERLGSTRNTLYKTVHDARKRLRHQLIVQGFLDPAAPEEAKP